MILHKEAIQLSAVVCLLFLVETLVVPPNNYI